MSLNRDSEVEVVRMPLEHSANIVGWGDKESRTPFQIALDHDVGIWEDDEIKERDENLKLPSEHGTDGCSQPKESRPQHRSESLSLARANALRRAYHHYSACFHWPLSPVVFSDSTPSYSVECVLILP